MSSRQAKKQKKNSGFIWRLIRALISLFVWFVALPFKIAFFFLQQIHNILYLMKVSSVVDTFAQLLILRRSQLIVKDHYGTANLTRWQREKAVFIMKFLAPLPKGMEQKKVENLIEARLKRYAEGKRFSYKVSSPIHYEICCKDILADAGWDAYLTSASGDQGVDIVATKSGVKVVFQCKWYSKPVGNAAVQEIVAGKLFEEADLAAVISNADFTEAARRLASKTGVHLLHHNQLREFAVKN